MNHLKRESLIVFIVSIFYLFTLWIYVYRSSGIMFSLPSMADEFIDPFDRLAETGTYAWKDGKPYAGRPPGLFVPYGFFRLFFGKEITIIVSGFFQLFLKALSVVYLFHLLSEIRIKRYIKYIFIIVYLVFPYWWAMDFKIHPYSISASVTIIMLYYFQKILITQNSIKNFLIVGLLTSYLFFLRPYLGILIIIEGCVLFFYLFLNKHSFKQTVTKVFFLFLPFIIIESTWIVRNFVHFKKIIPFQTTTSFSESSLEISEYDFTNPNKPSLLPLRKLFVIWGEPLKWYDSTSMPGRFISSDTTINYLPSYAYTKNVTKDSIKFLKKLIQISFSQDTTIDHKLLEKQIFDMSRRYLNYYKKDIPFHYWVKSILIKSKFLLLPHLQDESLKFPPQSKRSILIIISYYVILIIGLGAIVFYIIKFTILLRQRPFILFLLACCVANLFVFLLLLDTIYFLYFLSGYLMLFVLSAIFVNEWISKLLPNEKNHHHSI
ncbi:MAG: hypothetical protein KatS3mg027_0146 [Bacteroidia bacterium]|nr:MAG: hypothetical protein KatS3mg027_0146 [Bacteroidia bacterium]